MERRQVLKQVAIMLGGVISTPTLLAMQSQYLNLSLTNVFNLNELQRKIVAETAEMIIPRSSSAGAKDAGVPAFIEMMLKDCYKTQEQNNFLKGISQLEDIKFLEMNLTDRTKALKKVEADTKELMRSRNLRQSKIGDNDDKELMDNSNKGEPFWRIMKELTLLGYFTSERGITENFEYHPIPGKLEIVEWKAGQKNYEY
jgi:hypothetical protein